MSFLSGKHLSRRTVLKGAGATIALPLLDAMIPAGTAFAQTLSASTTRLGFVYFPHGALQDQWEPTKTGRWTWHGVLVCTGFEHHASIGADFPALAPHDVLRKWMYIDSTHRRFESTMEAVARCMARNDLRFGIVPHARSRGRKTRARTKRA